MKKLEDACKGKDVLGVAKERIEDGEVMYEINIATGYIRLINEKVAWCPGVKKKILEPWLL